MVTVKQILVPITFDEHAVNVLDFGRTLADACGADLHVLHVVSSPLGGAEAERACCAAARERMNEMLTEEDRGPRQARAVIMIGTPAHAIAEYAGEHAVDLIVMGTHSHAPSFQMVGGSIAEAVIGLAPCAVLAVKPPQPAGPPAS